MRCPPKWDTLMKLVFHLILPIAYDRCNKQKGENSKYTKPQFIIFYIIDDIQKYGIIANYWRLKINLFILQGDYIS